MTKDDEQRIFNLNIRLNATELADLRNTAGMTGLPLSTFARRALLGTPLTVTRWYALAPTDVAELKRLGNLLNQIARAGWRGRFTPSTSDLLDDVLCELRALLARAAKSLPRP